MDKLVELEKELCEHLGFGTKEDYDVVAHKYNTDELEHEHETKMETDYSKIFFLKNFPNTTSPFWNMKQGVDGKHANKVDVIMHGVETIGSAERSTDPIEMREQFYKISDGGYANILFSNFTKDRVQKELEDFLEFNFFDRCGGGIGVTSMIQCS